MNASPRVFWTGLALSLAAAVLIWMFTGTGWGAAIVMGYVRVMLVPSRFMVNPVVRRPLPGLVDSEARQPIDQKGTV